jgi:hypothetical protein
MELFVAKTVKISSCGVVIMTDHAVNLKVTACLRVECKFWLGNDGSGERAAANINHFRSGQQLRGGQADMEAALWGGE